ncbi:MAG TPA: hypothetical protein VJT83_00445 [Chitinophagaceae bacterium]|nr:hypothetical protein [Chitinophagaceae bacterium]
MNANNNFAEMEQSHPNHDHCSQEFLTGEGTTLVNSYVCSDRKFSVSDLWSIEKRKRQFTRRSLN